MKRDCTLKKAERKMGSFLYASFLFFSFFKHGGIWGNLKKNKKRGISPGL